MLSESQYNRLCSVASGECGESLDEAFNCVESSIELLYLSTIDVWEFGSECHQYEKFITHPLCDVSHIYSFFWSLSPGFVYKKRSLGRSLDYEQEKTLEVCDYFVRIVSSWSSISGTWGYNKDEYTSDSEKRKFSYIPSVMCQVTLGEQIDLRWFMNSYYGSDPN